jgi:YD repeat-containing protein
VTPYKKWLATVYNGNGQIDGILKNGILLSDYNYDIKGSLLDKINYFNNFTSKTSFVYNYEKNRVDVVNYYLSYNTSSDYLFYKKNNYENYGLNRFNGISINSVDDTNGIINVFNIYDIEYKYDDDTVNHLLSNNISEETFTNAQNANIFNYKNEYNNMGYIDRITYSDNTYVRYEYDFKGQLIWERKYNSTDVLTDSINYEYDLNGNIKYKRFLDGVGQESFKYTYQYGKLSSNDPCPSNNWNDQLTCIIGTYGGASFIEYDEIGNPTIYKGFTFGYEGRKLVSATSNNGVQMSLTYNDNGVRTSKKVNGVSTNFEVDGYKILSEVNGNNKLFYTYDESGSLVSVTHDDGVSVNNYFYR